MDNKRGQVIFYLLMLGIVVIILALALAPAVKETTDIARGDSTDTNIGMNCSSNLISDFDKAGCIAADVNIFYFIGSLIFIAGIIVSAKILFE